MNEELTLEERFLDGLPAVYTGNDESDDILCPFCRHSVARMDDDREFRPNHCPDCGTKIVY